MLSNAPVTKLRLFVTAAVVLATLGGTSGCAEKDDETKLATQVAARVNGDEITVHQINYVLERSGNVTPETAEQIKRQVLERLIDQQLAVQKAIENQLDRSPKVMQAIEASRREILARAYLETVAQSTPERFEWDVQIKEEVSDYYAAHPELFAQRRVFTIEAINFLASGEVAAALRQYMSKDRSMEDIAGWLKSQNIKFAARRSQRAAEQMSLEHLPQVQAMKAGEIGLFDLGNQRLQVIRVVSFKDAPVDEATAAPRIQQFLSNRQSRGVLANEMTRIRDQAHIEYLGEFAIGGPQTEDEAAAARSESEERAAAQGVKQ